MAVGTPRRRRTAKPIHEAGQRGRGETQCLYCSLYFQNVVGHQALMHKGEKPSDVVPQNIDNVGPGTVVRPITLPGQPLIPPYKKPWTRQWIEEGYECRQCRPGISRFRGPRESCSTCGGGPVTQMFPKVDYDPPHDMFVSPFGVRYFLKGGETNEVPSIVRDIAKQSIQERQKGMLRQDSDMKVAASRRLETTGFLPSLEEDHSF